VRLNCKIAITAILNNMTDINTIIRRARQEPDAFRELVIKLQNPLFRYLHLFRIPDAVIEDIAQETFVRAWQNLHRFDPEKASFMTWLFTIAKRLALNELNRAANKYVVTDSCGISETADPGSDSGEMHVANQQLQHQLNAAISQLPENFRNALMLFTFGELSIEQIADLEQCSIGTVKSRIHRAKKTLQSLLGQVNEVRTHEK